MNQTAIIYNIARDLFGKREGPFTYNALLLDEDTEEPLLIRHDGRGNIQHQAGWDGERWEVQLKEKKIEIAT